MVYHKGALQLKMLIPIININDIKTQDLELLIETGFCYIQLPNDHVIGAIKQCMNIAKSFFQKPHAEKTQWALKEILLEGERYQGYVVRAQSSNTKNIEQFFFEPDFPYGPYESHQLLIQEIYKTYLEDMTYPLIKALFNYLSFPSASFYEIIHKPTCSLVFQTLPLMEQKKEDVRLGEHRDYGLNTFLFFEEPGLQVFYRNEWEYILPKSGCVVMNIGNALELMTNGQCHSALHRVTNITDDRTSMVFFVNPNFKRPVKNYVTGEIISTSGEKFFKEQFAQTYNLDH